MQRKVEQEYESKQLNVHTVLNESNLPFHDKVERW